MTSQPQRPAFGTVLTSHMALTTYQDGKWSPAELKPVAPLQLSPAAHVLHYSSTCFEGFKAFRQADGSIHVFRMDRHIQRMRQSARQLVLPEPDAKQLADMVRALIDRSRDAVPEAPGALYLRPIIFGTTANIGAAATPATEATLMVLASPVWDYFAGGMKPLRILVDDVNTRSAAQMGMVKTGGNYAAALGPTLAARAKHQADQVLFCPGGEVQETGAANFFLIRQGELLTRSLDSTFLHGVTRDSLLTMGRDMGYAVSERVFSVKEMLEWARTGEAALSGTAAVLAGVGTLIHQGTEYKVGSGEVGPLTRALRAQLVSIQQGEVADKHGWLEKV
ncbi:MAG: branched-chain amino acid aminotransferase [Gammaproteobacteria bacterium]|jgi:branched-chain amino acid aminotransferase|nr:branched-chain amino acid aminotransferase [Gammaproteobacteria bacterium]